MERVNSKLCIYPRLCAFRDKEIFNSRFSSNNVNSYWAIDIKERKMTVVANELDSM